MLLQLFPGFGPQSIPFVVDVSTTPSEATLKDCTATWKQLNTLSVEEQAVLAIDHDTEVQ